MATIFKIPNNHNHYQSYERFFCDFNYLLNKLNTNPEISQSIISGDPDDVFFKAIEGKILIDYSDWNIAEIVLDCIKMKANLTDSEKKFNITDIKDEHISELSFNIDRNIKPLLNYWDKLYGFMQDESESERWEYEDKEQEESLDAEWTRKNGSDACDNCGWADGRNHNCATAAEDNLYDSENNHEESKIPLTVDTLISEIINDYRITQTAQYKKLESTIERQSEEINEYKKFISDISPLVEKLDKSPEIVQAILNGNITGDLARAIMEVKVSKKYNTDGNEIRTGYCNLED